MSNLPGSAQSDTRKRAATLGDLFGGGRGSSAPTPPRNGPTPSRGGRTPMRGSATSSNGRKRRWMAPAAPAADIDYGGAPSYSRGSSAPPATKSPPYPVRRDDPGASGRRRVVPRRDMPDPADVAADHDGYAGADVDADVEYGQPPEGYSQPVAALRRLHSTQRSRAEAGLRFTLNSAVIAFVVLILAVPIAVGLARFGIAIPRPLPQTSHLVPTPTVAQGYTGFQNTLFSLAYPSTWLREPGNGQFHNGAAVNVENFSDGHQQALAVITTGAVSSDQVPALFTEALAKAEVTSAHQLASGLALTYDGVTWNGTDYTGTLTRNGAHSSVKARVLAATSGGTTYFIALIAPEGTFAKADTQTFEPVLQSFRFQRP